jgi:hypothetical protein
MSPETNRNKSTRIVSKSPPEKARVPANNVVQRPPLMPGAWGAPRSAWYRR